MISKKNYIDTLLIEELRAVVSEFYEWCSEFKCPFAENPDFPCDEKLQFEEDKAKGKEEGEFGDYYCNNDSQWGCWVKYYVWKFRQKNKEDKDDRQKQLDKG